MHADAPTGREIPERSRRDPREIPKRLIARTLYRERTPRDPEPREIPERSQRDPERDPTSLHRVSGPRISPPRLKLYNVIHWRGGVPLCFNIVWTHQPLTGALANHHVALRFRL